MNSIYSNTSVSPEFVSRLRTMPKVELHVHLEGATDAATVWELARRNHVTLPAPSLEAWRSMYSFRDFDHFIDIYLLVVGCIQTPDDFAIMTERFLERQAEHNVKYCEAFISASLIQDKFPKGEVINALEASFLSEEAKAIYKIFDFGGKIV